MTHLYNQLYLGVPRLCVSRLQLQADLHIYMAFTWGLGIQTCVFMSAGQVYALLSYLSSQVEFCVQTRELLQP